MTRVLLLNHEPLEGAMAGTSIRNWELAKVLGEHHEVTLAAPGSPTRSHPGFSVVGYDEAGLRGLVMDAEVVVISGYLLARHPVLLEAAHLVVDLYDPFPLENLHMHASASTEDRVRIAEADLQVLLELARAGDTFLCASDRQADYWKGFLTAAGRVNPLTHGADPGLDELVRVVPFGVAEGTPSMPADAESRRFRRVLPRVTDASLVALWGGGLWEWFDPLSLVRAAALTEASVPLLQVVFPAAGSPSPEVGAMQMPVRARELAGELDLLGRRVHFGEAWIPYDERGSMLAEADIGISLHRRDIETRFSFRTRILDYLWAGLPIIATEGDSMADLVASEGLGVVVGYEDAEAVAAALEKLADPALRHECGERSLAVARRFLWPVVAAPLLEYCNTPFVAADRARMRARMHPLELAGARVGRLGARTVETLRSEGVSGVVRRVNRRLRN